MIPFDLSQIIGLIAEATLESIKQNIDRNETILRVLRDLGFDKKPITDDFDTLYVYTLVEYGVYKPVSVLNFFRNKYIREAFEKSFYEGNPVLLVREMNNVKEWNDESGELGEITTDLRKEADEFSKIFYKIVNYSRKPHDIEGFSKIKEIHKILVDNQKRNEFFSNESKVVQNIVNDKPEYWEFLLTIELLRNRLDKVKDDFKDLHKGLIYRHSYMVDRRDFINWIGQKMEDMRTLIQLLAKGSSGELMLAWGKPGEPGNEVEIKKAVDKIFIGCQGLFDWEVDLQFTIFPSEVNHIKEMMQNWGESYIEVIESIPIEISKTIELSNKQGEHHINLVFNSPPNIDDVKNEIARINM